MALTALLETCRRLGLDSDFLLTTDAELDLPRAVAEKAIQLRDEHRSDASLELLEAAAQQGICGGWLDDNRARALLELGRHEEARTLWTSLRNLDDLTLKTVADQMLHQLSLDDRLEELQGKVEALAGQHRWDLKRLSTQQESASAFEFALLEEAILARETGALSFSLALVDLAMNEGFKSPWLLDNRARALLAQDQILEACNIWRDLAERADCEEMRPVAESMLRTCRRQEEQAQKRQSERRWLDQSEQCEPTDPSAAITLLVRGLGNSPTALRSRPSCLNFSNIDELSRIPTGQPCPPGCSNRNWLSNLTRKC